MSAYNSSYPQTIDDKGRIVLPGKLRQGAGAQAEDEQGKIHFKMRFMDGCLALFTTDAWRPFEERFKALPHTTTVDRKRRRLFYMAVEDIVCDKQGRLTIPSYWREKAGLSQNIMIVGAGDHVEIWSEEAYRRIEQELMRFDVLSESAEEDPVFDGGG